MDAIFLRNSEASHWALMGEVLDRIGLFCAKYGSVADPALLRQSVSNHFAVGSPLVLAVALVDSPAGLVGHLLAETSDWAGSRFATILQYELDVPMPEDFRKRHFARIEEWARSIGAAGVQVFARNRAVARAFRRYGLLEDATLMRKALTPEGEQGVKEGGAGVRIPAGV